MASIQEDADYPNSSRSRVPVNSLDAGRTTTVSNKIRSLEDEVMRLRREKESGENTKAFKFPFAWMRRFGQSKKKHNMEKVLIMFLNKKNEIEKPVFVPIYSGNIVIYRNKAYEFDPRGIWRLRGVKGYPSVYLIREIDRRPLRNPDGTIIRDRNGRIVISKDAAISNLDIEEVRARGDSTESDEFLIKAALKAYTGTKEGKKMNWMIIGLILVGLTAAGWWFMKSGLAGQ